MGCTGAHIQPVSAEVILTKANNNVTWEDKPAKRVEFADALSISGAEHVQPKCMGTFLISGIQGGKCHAYRPIYKNRHGRFLYYCVDSGAWLVSSSFNDKAGSLMSSTDVDMPQLCSVWMVRQGSSWSQHVTAKVEELSDGLWSPNKDGIMKGDWVTVRALGVEGSRFKKNDRGRVVGMANERTCMVQFEGRSEQIPVAAWLLCRLPECFSGGDYSIAKAKTSFSLPH
jgi:hypothetical protein